MKNIFLLFDDSNLLTVLSNVNEFDINLTFEPLGWMVAKADPDVLWIVRIFKFLYMFNTFKVSVPIPTLLPTETDDGIFATNISVVNPAVGAAVTVEIVVVENVVIPTVKVLFNDDMSVLNPEILTESPGFKLWLIGVFTFILFSDHVKTEFSIFSTVVFKFDIALPPISDTVDTKPSPLVSVLSNSKFSPIL